MSHGIEHAIRVVAGLVGINQFNPQATLHVGGTLLVDTPGAWTSLVYSNSWADVGSGWTAGAWWKDSLGVVHLRGLLQRAGTAVSGETAFTLPLGPPLQETFLVSGLGGAVYRMDMTPGGVAQIYVASAGPYLALSGLSFRTT